MFDELADYLVLEVMVGEKLALFIFTHGHLLTYGVITGYAGYRLYTRHHAKIAAKSWWSFEPWTVPIAFDLP